MQDEFNEHDIAGAERDALRAELERARTELDEARAELEESRAQQCEMSAMWYTTCVNHINACKQLDVQEEELGYLRAACRRFMQYFY